jgi:hypothetical protein
MPEARHQSLQTVTTEAPQSALSRLRGLLNLSRRFGIVALMLFMLAGVQLIQVSPLHDHTRHSVDCGLCHVPLADEPASTSGLLPDFVTSATWQPALSAPAPSSTNPSPYQGRAPPRILS